MLRQVYISPRTSHSSVDPELVGKIALETGKNTAESKELAPKLLVYDVLQLLAVKI